MNMFKTTRAKTPQEYIDLIDEPRKSQVKQIHELIRKTVPNLKPFMVSGMIGYGSFHYKSKSGREGEWAVVSLASQKNYISLYSCATDGKEYLAEKYKDKLPKANIGRSCIRFKKIEDVDLGVIKEILVKSEQMPNLFEGK